MLYSCNTHVVTVGVKGLVIADGVNSLSANRHDRECSANKSIRKFIAHKFI